MPASFVLRSRPRTIVLLISFLCITPFTFTHGADEYVRSVFGVGAGIGTSTAHGDFLKDHSEHYFGFALELESDNWYFQFGGGSGTTPPPQATFKDQTLVAGVSWGRIILGLGFQGMETAGPTTASVNLPFVHVAADLDTTFSVTGLGLFTRLRPVMSHNFTINLDGFYALTTRGSMTVPVYVVGLPGYLNSEPQHQGGYVGYGAEILWRLPTHDQNIALKLSIHDTHAIMIPQTSGYMSDPFHVFGNVATPHLQFENRSAMLSVVLVTP